MRREGKEKGMQMSFQGENDKKKERHETPKLIPLSSLTGKRNWRKESKNKTQTHSSFVSIMMVFWWNRERKVYKTTERNKALVINSWDRRDERDEDEKREREMRSWWRVSSWNSFFFLQEKEKDAKLVIFSFSATGPSEQSASKPSLYEECWNLSLFVSSPLWPLSLKGNCHVSD